MISNFTLKEGESITFVLREPPTPTTSGVGKDVDSEHHSSILIVILSLLTESKCFIVLGCPQTDQGGESKATSTDNPELSQVLLDRLLEDTTRYWLKWISQSVQKISRFG